MYVSAAAQNPGDKSGSGKTDPTANPTANPTAAGSAARSPMHTPMHALGGHDLGVHDLGGASGYGAVPHDPNEPPFHHTWEGRVFGIFGPALASSGKRPGEFRHALERLAPGDYFGNGYYGRWLAGIELLLSEYDVLKPGELDQRLGAPAGSGPASRARPLAETDAVLDAGLLPAEQEQSNSQPVGQPTLPPLFQVGDAVVTRPRQKFAHTRLPAYAEAKKGVIAELHGTEVLPDSTAHDLGDRPQHVYAVAFEAAELWGADVEPEVTIHIDMYECYLDSANPA